MPEPDCLLRYLISDAMHNFTSGKSHIYVSVLPPPPLQWGMVLQWFCSVSPRNTFVGSTCALPSALLVWWCVIPVHRVLDVGQSNDDSPYLFTGDTTAVMSMLMSSLPCLTHLDISGTNLAGFVKEQPESHRLTPYSTVRHENHELVTCLPEIVCWS